MFMDSVLVCHGTKSPSAKVRKWCERGNEIISGEIESIQASLMKLGKAELPAGTLL